MLIRWKMPQLEMPFDAVHWCEYKSCLIFIEFSKYDETNIQNHANSTPLWLALCESFIQIYPHPHHRTLYLCISFVLYVLNMWTNVRVWSSLCLISIGVHLLFSIHMFEIGFNTFNYSIPIRPSHTNGNEY